MVPKFNSCMIFGVGIKLSRHLFQTWNFASLKWNIIFLSTAHHWKIDLFTSLFTLLYSIRVRRGGDDRICWIPSRRGLFDVGSYYNVLVPHDSTPFHWTSIWRNKAPLRVTFFAWSAALEAI